MRKTTTLTVLAVLGIVALAGTVQGQSDRESPGFAVFSGRVTFQRYCASCHGAEGHGDGNVAQYLKIPPADLTRIQAENDGEFPADDVRAFIDGRRDVAGHGTREMPVWGEVFQSSAKPMSRRLPTDSGM